MSDRPSEADVSEPRIEIGPLCPPIQSWFFPNDPDEKPRTIEEKENEHGDTAQSA